MTRLILYTLPLLLGAAACKSATGPAYAILEVGNSVRTRTPVRVTVEAVAASQDTLYDRVLAPGGWGCGKLLRTGHVRVIVRAADTVIVGQPFDLERATIWAVAVLMEANGLAVEVSPRETSACGGVNG